MTDDDFDAQNLDPGAEEDRGWRDSLSESSRQVVESGRQFVRSLGKQAQEIQRRRGEDYNLILEHNPFVQNGLRRADVIYQEPQLASTFLNIPWRATASWAIVSGLSVPFQRNIIDVLNPLLHTGPGHIKMFEDVNRYMDSVSGRGHRLKHGHSIEYLPAIIDQFGVKGVPAFFLHLMQDMASPDGIPVVPYAWNIKGLLQKASIRPQYARYLVTMNIAKFTALVVIIGGGDLVAKQIEAYASKQTEPMALAEDALAHGDTTAAIENYLRALDIDRTPVVLLKLGDIYSMHEQYRLRAFSIFDDAFRTLSSSMTYPIEVNQAQVSLRGWAALNALSTLEAIEGLSESIVDTEIERLVNGAAFSFMKTGQEQLEDSGRLATPPHFSAAINYYLAAVVLASYPWIEERRERIVEYTKMALEALNSVASYDEDALQDPIEAVKHAWTSELLLPEDIESDLAGYIFPQ